MTAANTAATLIARLIGPWFVALGLGLLLNRTFYIDAIIQGTHSPVVIFLAGSATLLGGLAILNAHRSWTADWRSIVTIIGWMFVIAGTIRIVLPSIAASITPAIYAGTTAIMVTGIVVLIVGGYLSFEGYRR
jgi:hypothetical protein